MKMENPSYLPPEGQHTGTITNADIYHDVKNGKERESVRFTIALDTAGPDRMTKYMARIDYWNSQTGMLYEDAKRLIGSKVNELVDKESVIIPEALSILIGQRVTVKIVHENRPGYEHAFRKVSNLRPAVSSQPQSPRIRFRRAA